MMRSNMHAAALGLAGKKKKKRWMYDPLTFFCTCIGFFLFYAADPCDFWCVCVIVGLVVKQCF